jgi:hypothetical protein
MKITDFKPGEKMWNPGMARSTYRYWGDGASNWLCAMNGECTYVSLKDVERDDWEPYEPDADKIARLERLVTVEIEHGNRAYRDGGISALRSAIDSVRQNVVLPVAAVAAIERVLRGWEARKL